MGMQKIGIKVFSIILSVISIFIVSNYFDREVTSGFVLQRSSILAYQLPDGNIIQGFETLPFEGGLFAILSSVTGMTILDILYLPLIVLLSIPFIYLGMRLVTDNSILIVLASSSLVIFQFVAEPHYKDYYITIPLFIPFMYCCYMWLSKDDMRYSLILMILFLTIHFMGPPISMWGVSLFMILSIWVFLNRQNLAHSSSWRSKIGPMAILSIVVYFWDNDKVFEQFFGLQKLSLFTSNLSSIFENDASSIPYEHSAEYPELYIFSTAAWYIFATLPIAIGFLWRSYTNGLHPKNRKKKEIFLILVIGSTIGWMFIYYFLVGELRLRPIRLIGPFISVYYLYNLAPKRVYYIFGILFICFALLSTGSVFAYQVNSPATPQEPTSQTTDFYFEHMQGGFTTDFQTHGEIQMASGMSNTNPESLSRNYYDQNVMGMVVNGGDPPESAGSYLIVNKFRLDRPIVSGVDWIQYQPLNNSYDQLMDHRGMNKIYSNGYHESMDLNNSQDGY
jgi:hypothetical protein